MADPLLEVQNLKVAFDTEAGVLGAVDGTSFSVAKGHALGIVGESGCGKSVTAMSILRLVPSPPGRIVSGRILWKGEDLLSLPMKRMPEVRGRQIGMVFQDPMSSLNPVFTVGKLMLEVLKHRHGISGNAARVRAAEALDEVGIPDAASRLSSYPHELSGGMKQRVMIAMALLSEPELLIADEPTTALDVTIQKQILHLLKTLQRDRGMALILITHDIGVIAETCDTVAVMYAGRIVERCDVYTLFEKNRHPYTRGLLNSVPRRGMSKDEPLPTIEGNVPSLISPPKGCRFASRCGNRLERCIAEDPKLEEIAPGHEIACFNPVEAPR